MSKNLGIWWVAILQALGARGRGPHSTEIFRKYCGNILWQYCKISKIFRKLSLILLKYCNNLAMSAQNMTYVIFSKYYKKWQMHKQCFFSNKLYRKLSLNFLISIRRIQIVFIIANEVFHNNKQRFN